MISSYLDYILITISTYPMVVQIAIYVIIINTIAGLLLFFNMIRLRRKLKKQDDFLLKNLPKNEAFLREILNDDQKREAYEIVEKYEARIAQFSAVNHDVLIRALENLVLERSEFRRLVNYRQIIDTFDLVNYLEENMDAYSRKKRLAVFRTLSNLELTVSDFKILPHTYSKDKSIKKGSRSSYVSVSKNDPFKFFETNRETELNEWDQISLMKQFEEHHRDSLPDFSKWIRYTKQKSQIIFFVRMTAHFHQKNSIDTISELLNHQDHDIRREAIVTLGVLGYSTIEAKLMRMFHSQPESCQKEIVKVVTLFNTGLAFDFLKTAYEAAANIDTKLLLAEALYLYKPKGLQYFRNKIQHEQGFNQLILKHVENPLIKSELKELVDGQKSSSASKKRIKVSQGPMNVQLQPVLIN